MAVARIARPRGLKGELVAELLTDFPERFEALETVIAVRDGERRELKIEKFWFQNERIVFKFDGLDTVESTEMLRDFEICIPESDAVELETDEFYDWQLEGCRVESIDGEVIGTVKELLRTGGADLLIVSGETKEYLIPFVELICSEVDIQEQLIVIDPPEGLLDF